MIIDHNSNKRATKMYSPYNKILIINVNLLIAVRQSRNVN